MLLADRIIILDNGEIVQDFSKTEIVEKIDVLKKYNIKIPEIVKILNKLKNKGMNIELTKWTMSELVDKIVGDKS